MIILRFIRKWLLFLFPFVGRMDRNESGSTPAPGRRFGYQNFVLATPSFWATVVLLRSNLLVFANVWLLVHISCSLHCSCLSYALCICGNIDRVVLSGILVRHDWNHTVLYLRRLTGKRMTSNTMTVRIPSWIHYCCRGWWQLFVKRFLYEYK